MRVILVVCVKGEGAWRCGKVPVFGLLERAGDVYTAIISDAKASTLIPIILEKVLPDSIVYTDSFQVYEVLDVSEFHHRRVNHSKVFVSEHGHHINGIENFWNQAKRHLRRFNGIPKGSFYWFSKNVNGASTAGAIKPCYSSSEPGIGSKSPGISYSSPWNFTF